MAFTQRILEIKDNLPRFTCTEEALKFGVTANDCTRAALEWRMHEYKMFAIQNKECRNLNLAMKFACYAQFDHEALQAHDILKREG